MNKNSIPDESVGDFSCNNTGGWRKILADSGKYWRMAEILAYGGNTRVWREILVWRILADRNTVADSEKYSRMAGITSYGGLLSYRDLLRMAVNYFRIARNTSDTHKKAADFNLGSSN